MLNIRGITDAKVEKIFEAAQKIESMSFQTGFAILQKRKKIKRISTGSPSFDMLIGGACYFLQQRNISSQGLQKAQCLLCLASLHLVGNS